MKASVDKLRWALAGGSLFLLLLLLVVVGYGRYMAARLWKNRLDKMGVHIEQTTDNVTYSQTIQGRTVFTLRAGKAVQRKDGKTTLHNVQLTLYGKKDGSEDRIYGSEFEYDEKAGVARALGDVEMDLKVPGSLSKNGTSGAGTNAIAQDAGRDIHVRTSGLTYVRKLGVAATDQPVMLSYAGLQCTAKGAEFNSSEGIVHLLAEVHLLGDMRGKPVELHAAKADLNHATNTVALTKPDVKSGEQTGRAANAVVQLRHDGSLETAQAEGNVTLQKLTRQMTAARLDSRFTTANVVEQASLTGGVRLVDTNAAKPMRGSANRVDGVFDANGAPVRWKASGGALLETSVKSPTGQMLSRSLRGEQLEAVMKPGKSRSNSELSSLHVTGAAKAFAEAANPAGLRTTQLFADDLNASFGPGIHAGSPVLEQVVGTGQTRLQQDGPGTAQQASTGNFLQIHFAPDEKKGGPLQIASATQDGDVQLQSRPAAKGNGGKATDHASARADHSAYDGATGKLTLTGHAEFRQGNMSVTASSLTVDQQNGDSDASGNVLTTVTATEGGTSPAPTHIQADRAHLERGAQMSVFYGSPAKPARLWQGPSQVEAASISIDGERHTLAARPDVPSGLVHAVFASAGEKKDPNNLVAHGPQVERIVANSLDYDDLTRIATFSGNLQAQGSTGQVRAQHAQMFFGAADPAKKIVIANGSGSSPSFGGSLQKAVLWGDVQLSQPGKTGRGDKLVYTAADSTFLLTGSASHMPQVVDAEHGSVTGAALLFHSGDNKVVVSSSAAVDNSVRVHTETGAKQ